MCVCTCVHMRVACGHVSVRVCVSTASAFVHVCEYLCACDNKDRTTMGNQAVSSCNFMFSNYEVDTVFLTVLLLAETQGLIFLFIFMLMIQLSYQSIKRN